MGNQIKRLTLRETESENLVLFFPWLGAKEKHVEKYVSKLYDPIGANVEVFQLDIFDFLKPQKTIDYFKPVSRELEKDDRKVLIHGFSIGAFAVAGLQVAATEENTNLEKISGVIWDSIVIGSKENMKEGIVRSTPKPVQPLTAISASIIFKIYNSNWPLWNRMIEAVKNCEKFENKPQLVYFSDDDPMCNKEAISEMFENWNGEKFLHSWPKSAHVAHLLKHENDYLKTHEDFMTFCKIK